jgi:Cep192 domain 4
MVNPPREPQRGSGCTAKDAGFLFSSGSARIDFGRHPIGELSDETDKTVLLVSGSETLTTHLALTSKDFYAYGCTIPGQLHPSKKCAITVVFAPSTRGRKAAVLRITRESGAPLQIALSGTGVPNER